MNDKCVLIHARARVVPGRAGTLRGDDLARERVGRSMNV